MGAQFSMVHDMNLDNLHLSLQRLVSLSMKACRASCSIDKSLFLTFIDRLNSAHVFSKVSQLRSNYCPLQLVVNCRHD